MSLFILVSLLESIIFHFTNWIETPIKFLFLKYPTLQIVWTTHFEVYIFLKLCVQRNSGRLIFFFVVENYYYMLKFIDIIYYHKHWRVIFEKIFCKNFKHIQFFIKILFKKK